MPRVHVFLMLLVALLPVLATTATAAQRTNAPPGNAAIDEYLETVPGVSGDAPARPPLEPGAATLTAAQRAELQALGADGEMLADVVDATAPAPRTAAPASAQAPPPEGRSPVAAAFGATTGGDGGSALGPLLPAILLTSLLCAVALAVARRRGRT